MFRPGPTVNAPQGEAALATMAGELRKALKGAGTDEKTIIRIASTHNFIERALISRAFTAQFGLSLEKELKSDLAGNIENLLVGVFEDRHEFWARKIHEAIKGAGTDEKKLISMVILMSDEDYKIVSTIYAKNYGKDMFHAIDGDTGAQDWARLIKAWMKGQNNAAMSPEQAAEQLHQAAKGAGTDEDVFISIMCNMVPDVYRAVAVAYHHKFGKTLRQTIEKEFTGKSEFAFLLCHDYLINPAEAVASLLKTSMKGAGTNDELLVNVTVLMSDYFRGQAIAGAYKKFGDLAKDIKSDLTGKYEDAMLAMWGFK
ncbi:Annexin_9 [Hexamita inflata]|uniref:Annexin 9 n=1 Tax=Hexamita inflata TaxID=28002 RepID=A0AA86R1Q2_9EUKA|nr:Annexin 9 [Hexamita inflata]